MLAKLAYFSPALLLAFALPGMPAAASSITPIHGHGANPRAEKNALNNARIHGALASANRIDGAATPASFDLSKYALPAGDQGQVNSCVSWATGYSATGLLMKKQGITGAPMAPMYLYAQIAHGQDKGSSSQDNLSIEKQQGIDTKSDYSQGDFDYTSQPTAAEKQQAAHYRISGFDYIGAGSAAKAAIESAVSQGHPVIMLTYIRQSFERLTSAQASGYRYVPGGNAADPVTGSHGITIIGYTEQGVRIQNSWGAGWGNKGFADVSWKFVESADAEDFTVVHDLVK